MGSKVEEMKMEDFIKIEKIGEGNKRSYRNLSLFFGSSLWQYRLKVGTHDGTSPCNKSQGLVPSCVPTLMRSVQSD